MFKCRRIFSSHWISIDIYEFTHIQILSFCLHIYTVQKMNEGGHQGFFQKLFELNLISRLKIL